MSPQKRKEHQNKRKVLTLMKKARVLLSSLDSDLNIAYFLRFINRFIEYIEEELEEEDDHG